MDRSRHGRAAAEVRVRSRIVPMALRVLRSWGRDTDPIAAKFGWSPSELASGAIALTPAAIRAFWCEVEASTGDGLVGHRVALALGRGAYGVPEYVARNAATLGDALERFCDHMRMLGDVPVLRFRRAGAHALFEHELPEEPEGLGEQGNLFVVSLAIRILREVGEVHVRPREVRLAHAGAVDANLAEYWGTSQFALGAGKNVLVFDTSALDVHLPGADPNLLPLLERVVDPVESQALAVAAPELLADVARAIRAMLPETPTLARAASAARVTPRTLQRHLEVAATTFRALVDDVRRAAADELLAHTTTKLEVVAALLGYGDSRAFIRAFKRWHGSTPGEHRRVRSHSRRLGP